jgi:glycosyltransferase involved in cell wall biosynthesis
MKIAIDVREADGEKTGKGFFAYGLVNQLLTVDRHNQYLLYTDKDKTPFPEYPNVEVRFIAEQGMKWHWQVLKDLKISRPDLYLAPTSFIVPALAPRWLKVIIVVHDLVAFMFPKSHAKKAVIIERVTLRRALKKAVKVFVVSENTQNDLIKIFRYPKPMMVEVPAAPHDLYKEDIDPKQSEKVREKFGLPEKFILGVGTLEPRKNFSALIKAFVIVKRKFPEYKLVIVGKKGWKYQDIERSVREFQLEKDVIFTGYMKDEDLHHTYNLAEVFVFPSLYEGFGIPPLEAMASGCPVISSNAASLPEVVGDAGLLIEPSSSHKIADAIISLIENPQLKNTLLEKGFHRSRKFSWVETAQIVLDQFAIVEQPPKIEQPAEPSAAAESGKDQLN